MMDPTAEIEQELDHVPDMAYVDAKRLWQCSAIPADPVSKVLDDDNLLIKILLRLGFPTTLVCAALVCKRWLGHAFDPAFLCRFRKLHPPCLLGFYLDVRSWYWDYSQPQLNFIPMLPQPTELALVARRVGSYSFDADQTVWIEDCQNGSILIRACRNGTSFFGAGVSSSSRLKYCGEVFCPLGPIGAGSIISCPPHDPPKDSEYVHTGYTLFKQGGQDLFYLSLFEEPIQEGTKYMAHVYMLQDGVWCMHTSATTQHPCQTWTVRPLLVDNKIYIAAGLSGILILDLKASSFSKINLPEGVEHGKSNTMFSRTDDDSRVYLIHVKELQLRIWLHNGDNWLLVDAICLREMYDNLRVSDVMVSIASTDVVKINQVGQNAESACIQVGRSVLYLDIKCRIMHRVYEMAENDQQYFGGIYPLMMIWPPTFPALKDDLQGRGVGSKGVDQKL